MHRAARRSGDGRSRGSTRRGARRRRAYSKPSATGAVVAGAPETEGGAGDAVEVGAGVRGDERPAGSKRSVWRAGAVRNASASSGSRAGGSATPHQPNAGGGGAGSAPRPRVGREASGRTTPSAASATARARRRGDPGRGGEDEPPHRPPGAARPHEARRRRRASDRRTAPRSASAAAMASTARRKASSRAPGQRRRAAVPRQIGTRRAPRGEGRAARQFAASRPARAPGRAAGRRRRGSVAASPRLDSRCPNPSNRVCHPSPVGHLLRVMDALQGGPSDACRKRQARVRSSPPALSARRALSFPKEGAARMANHLTPEELSKELGIDGRR